MPIDLKTEPIDSTIPAGAILFGADSQSAARPSPYTAETVAFAFYQRSATATSGIDYGAFRQVNVAPTANSSAVFFGRTSRAYYTSTSFDIVGAGHLVGGISWAAHSTSRTLSLVIGHESKIDNESTGVITEAIIHEAQLSSNLGTITTLVGNNARPTANSGTITTFVGYRMPDLSAITGITNKFFAQNLDPEAPLLSAAPVIDQSTQLAFPTGNNWVVNISPRRQKVFIAPDIDVANATINFPAVATVVNGQQITITLSKGVSTGLTWGANGASFVYARTTTIPTTTPRTVTFTYFSVNGWWIETTNG